MNINPYPQVYFYVTPLFTLYIYIYIGIFPDESGEMCKYRG